MGLAQVVEAAGSLDTNALIKTMETLEYEGLGGPVKFGAKDHRLVLLRGYRPVYGVHHLPGGKAAIVWPADAGVKS